MSDDEAESDLANPPPAPGEIMMSDGNENSDEGSSPLKNQSGNNESSGGMLSPGSMGPGGSPGPYRGRGRGGFGGSPGGGMGNNSQGPNNGPMMGPMGPRGGGPRFRGRGGPGYRGPPPPGFRGPPPFGPRGPRYGPRGHPPHFDNWGPMPPPPGMGGPMGPPGMPPMCGMGPMGPMGPPGPWGGPMGPQGNSNQNQNQQGGGSGNMNLGSLDLSGEIWVETKAGEGKAYYYNARTRETTWTKPEGENVKILTQSQVEQMAQAAGVTPNNMSNGNNQENQGQNSGGSGSGGEGGEMASEQDRSNDNGNWQQGGNGPQWGGGSGPGMGGPPNQGGPPGYNMGPQGYGGPGHYGMPPGPPGFGPGPGPGGPGWNGFGMGPGPHMGGPPGGWGGMPPPGMGMGGPMGDHQGPNQDGPMQPPMHMPKDGESGPGGKDMNDSTGNDLSKSPGVPGLPPGAAGGIPSSGGDDAGLNPDLVANAAQWTEHKAPDNRSYFYNSASAASVWEKPQEMKDLDAARLELARGILTSLKGSMNVAPGTEASGEPSGAGSDSGSIDGMKEEDLHMNGKAPGEAADDEASMEVDSETSKDNMGDSDESKPQQDMSRPVSSQPVSGTPWCVVWTGDRRVFFYNPTTKTSVWEKPPELLDKPEIDKMMSTPPPEVALLKARGAASVMMQEEPPAKKPKMEVLNQVHVMPAVAMAQVQPINSSTTISLTIKDEIRKIDVGKEAAMEAEMKAARERALVPLDLRMKQFRDLLAEKGVSAFSSWEKELSKIVFDPRYLLLVSRERKQVFEKYVKERADEERREKRSKLKERKDDFRRLLEEAGLSGKAMFSEFAASKWAKDERFRSVEKMRERESLFDEYILDVRRREKDEEKARREQVRKDYVSLLKEVGIDHHARWSDSKRKVDSDARYKAVTSSAQREDWFRDFVARLKEDRRRSRDKSRDRVGDRRDHRDRDRDRDRERDRDRDRDRERVDRDRKRRHSGSRERDSKSSRDRKEEKKRKKKEEKEARKEEVEEKEKTETAVEPPTTTEEAKQLPEEEKDERPKSEAEESGSEAEKANRGKEEDAAAAAVEEEKEKRRRVEESLRKREEEVQRALAGHLRDRDKERQQHKHDEAELCFNALLADLVRSTDFTWKEAKKSLKKDSRWESASALERDEKERLFNQHLETLTKRKREKFRELLDEMMTTTLDCSWKELKKGVKEDPRYTKFSSSDKKCEREFKEYVKDRQVAAKADFRELLKETKVLTHKSLKQCTEGESHMREVLEMLQKDKRYLILDSMPDDRSKILMGYLEELEKRGPPPPPTASEPTRRK